VGVVQLGAARRRRELTRRNNDLRSKGARALRIGLAMVSCPPSERGRYLTALTRALRVMLAEGVELPSQGRVERDIDAVLDRHCRKGNGR
jgi:hypothetical protein